MTTPASKCLFLFLLSILIVSSSEVSPVEEFKQKELKREQEQMFHFSHGELLKNIHFKAIQHDLFNPPTTVPTTPMTNTGTTPNNNPTPTIVTVPSTNPATVVPNPASTPLTVPPTTPVPVPNTNPVYTPAPVTNPVTSPTTNPVAPPVTNPVTTYPAPPGNVPVTTPTPVVTPPAATNTPSVPGQSWCVAKTGTVQTALQSALDYACGIGGADCSAIQQTGSCYNPNSLQNHASYAFNSYYQKNPVQSSCDFGGTAMISNTNPSSGSCVYPSSSTSSSSPVTATPTPTPTTPMPTPATPTPTTPTPTTTSSSGATVPGADTPTVLNTSYPASGMPVFGESPPILNTSTSMSTSSQPLFGCIILVTSMITGIIIQDM